MSGGAGGRCHPAGEPTACSAVDDAGVDAAVDAADGGLPVGAFKALAVGQEFACAITMDGSQVSCWGENVIGQLGDGSFIDRPTAAPIGEPGPWRAIAAGSYHACAIKDSGALFCWGEAAYGQVDGSNANQTPPRHPL